MARRLLLAALLAACALGAARADTVHLRDGRKVQGEATWSADGKKLEIKTRFGSIVVKKDEVLRIDVEETPEQELARRRAALAADDMAGRVALAEWCLERRFERDAAALLLEVVAAEPQGDARKDLDAAALEPFRDAGGLLGARLDYHLEDGRWVPPDEWYPARGFVRHRGKWVRRELVDTIQQLEEAEEAIKQRRVELRRAERAVEPAQAEVTEAEAKKLKLERTLANLAGEKRVAELDLTTKEEDRRAAEDRLERARRTLELFLVSRANDGSPKAQAALITLQNDVAAREGEVTRAQRAEKEAREKLEELVRLEARGPQLRQEAADKVVAARAALGAAQEGLEAARKAVTDAATLIEQLEQRIKTMKRDGD